LADQLWKHLQDAKQQETFKQNSDMDLLTLEILHRQIWEILPTFMNQPIDFLENFSTLSEKLRACFNDPKVGDLKLVIIRSLHTLAQSFATRPSFLSSSDSSSSSINTTKVPSDREMKEIKLLNTQASIYIPLFLSYLFSTKSPNVVLEVIESFFNLCEMKTREYYCIQAITKLLTSIKERNNYQKKLEEINSQDLRQEEDTNIGNAKEKTTKQIHSFTSNIHLLMDVLIPMITYLSVEFIDKIYKAIVSELKSTDPIAQKKSI